MTKKWKFYESDVTKLNEICKKYDLNKIVAQIILNRNVTEDEEIKVFINPNRNDFHNPFLFKDMNITVDRIIKAIEQKENIVIYGDYDVDGITSTTVLKKFLLERGAVVDTYIPNRLTEGYGLNKIAIEQIKENKTNLIITVDCRDICHRRSRICQTIGNGSNNYRSP